MVKCFRNNHFNVNSFDRGIRYTCGSLCTFPSDLGIVIQTWPSCAFLRLKWRHVFLWSVNSAPESHCTLNGRGRTGQVIAELSCVSNHGVGDVIVLEGGWHAVTEQMGLERRPVTQNFKHIRKSVLFTFLLLRNRLYFTEFHAQCKNLEFTKLTCCLVSSNQWGQRRGGATF